MARNVNQIDKSGQGITTSGLSKGGLYGRHKPFVSTDTVKPKSEQIATIQNTKTDEELLAEQQAAEKAAAEAAEKAATEAAEKKAKK